MAHAFTGFPEPSQLLQVASLGVDTNLRTHKLLFVLACYELSHYETSYAIASHREYESSGGAPMSGSPPPLRSFLKVLDNEREEEQKHDTAKEHRSSLFGLP